jgi:hypothetical protein
VRCENRKVADRRDHPWGPRATGIQLLGRRDPEVGPAFRAYLTFYGVERFFLEFVRLKTDLYFFGLTSSEMAQRPPTRYCREG